MSIQPFILGSGRAAQAIHHSLSILKADEPELGLLEPVRLQRQDPLRPSSEAKHSVLFIANPHGLHTEKLIEATRAGFHGVGSEKPVCVTLEQARKLKGIDLPVAVYHVYRQMWGPQTLKAMMTEQRFGKVITIEGRYWQASTAERALMSEKPTSWKDDTRLSGPSDTLLDTGTHWADAACFLMGEQPKQVTTWRSYANAQTPHRDSHVHLTMDFASGTRALSSISKTFHGGTNHFEINIIGTLASATWNFLTPDEILLGEGRERRVMTRKTTDRGSGHPPFHATGWLEGYIEINRQLLHHVSGREHSAYPGLNDTVPLTESLLKTLEA